MSETTRGVSARAAETDSEEGCGIAGNFDAYGLGIRLGLYLQWLTSSITYLRVPKEAANARGINNCFQAAMFAGLIFLTVRKQAVLHAAEAFLMLVFCMGGTCAGIIPPGFKDVVTGVFSTLRGRSQRLEYSSSVASGLERCMLNFAVLSYGVWFTFKGMNHMLHPPCTTYVFFFAKVDLSDWFRVLFKMIFSLAAIVFAVFVIFELLYATFASYQFLSGDRHEYEGVGQNKGTTPITGDQLRDNGPFSREVYLSIGYGTSVMLGCFVIMIELMIRWNRISGVNRIDSTSQLIPLVISIGGLLRVAYCWAIRLLKKSMSGEGGLH